MRILISNDDGIYSPGILALAKVASRFGEVRIVAPDVEQSSMGHAITASRPLRYKRIRLDEFDAYRVNGTPADCVALGTHQWQHTDVVLSGINLGLNLGNSCWHSGTLAAAKQAALLGLRGIAISTEFSDKQEPNFSALEPYVTKVLELLLEEKAMSLVNVNLPPKPRGIRWTRQSVRQYDGKVVPSKDPMGRPIYWFTITPLEGAEEGTDRWAVEHSWVSITPLRLDLTDEKGLTRALALHHTPPIASGTSGNSQRNKNSRRGMNKKARSEKS
ncbi:MAG TPA: 5'/3'-nucleotidase SurE [Candidatus Udaeobacter sp.]|nr:MAG: 5'/3'-nucleotidase SurE [Verrucomicrobiota bacterium]HMC24340.1 5'/3'-nucleotidase SurE [Candidatus Udaeobacter sp.]